MDGLALEQLPLIAPRVVLRRLAPADLSDFQAYRHDPTIGRYQGWLPLPDEQAIEFLTTMHTMPLFQPGLWTQIGIAERHTNILIGDIGICVAPERHTAEIGFSLRQQSHGRGLATEAIRTVIPFIFAHTDVEQVLGEADVRNTASSRLMERVGMHKVSMSRAVIREQSCLVDVYTFPRVRAGELTRS